MVNKYGSLGDLPITLTANDIAIVLNVSRVTAYSLMHADGFPVLKIGGRILVPRDKFIEWVEQHTSTVQVVEIA